MDPSELVEQAAENAEKVQKFPWGFAFMVLGGLAGIFASKMFDSSESHIKAVENERDKLRGIVVNNDKKCDSVALFWQNKYLAQVEYSLSKERKQDSILQRANQDLTKAIKKINNE